jgi:hypothetical protein
MEGKDYCKKKTLLSLEKSEGLKMEGGGKKIK